MFKIVAGVKGTHTENFRTIQFFYKMTIKHNSFFHGVTFKVAQFNLLPFWKFYQEILNSVKDDSKMSKIEKKVSQNESTLKDLLAKNEVTNVKSVKKFFK